MEKNQCTSVQQYLQTTVSENNQNSKNSFSWIILIGQGRQYDRESCYTKIQEIGRERDVIGELGYWARKG